MAAPSASRAGFTPIEAPAVAVSADGRLVAVHQAGRVTLLDLPSVSAFAEVGVDPDAHGSEVGWIGTPAKLLVLSRYESHSTVHLLDPEGPRSIAEIRLEVPMRLAASVGGSALVVGAVGAAVIAATDTHLTVYPFPSRTVPQTAGAAGKRFVIATPGAIEEWDPDERTPTRKMRLPRAASISGVGGSERVVWLTTPQEPQRIDVIPLINRGQPRAHELPEPILRVASHPRSDMLAVIGAESGKLYAVDLEGRIPMHVVALENYERFEAAAMLGSRNPLAIVAQAGRPIALVSLAGKDEDPLIAMSAGPEVAMARLEVEPSAPAEEPEPEAPSSLYGDGEGDVVEEPIVVEDVELAGPQWSGDVVAPEPDAADADAAAGEPSAPDEPAPDDEVSDAIADDDGPRPSTGLRGLRARSARPAARMPIARAQPPASSPSVRPPIARRSVEAPRPRAAEPSARSASERFSAWRDQVRQSQPRDAEDAPPPAPVRVEAEPVEAPPVVEAPVVEAPRREPVRTRAVEPRPMLPRPARAPIPPRPAAEPDEPKSWRDELVTWTRAVLAGAPPMLIAVPPIEALIARLEVATDLTAVLALLYGAHLVGERGVPPAEVARLLGRSWDEALGRGELAQHALATFAQSRVTLAPVVQRFLDELPPLTGVVIGDTAPIALLGPCCVVAPDDEPLGAVAFRSLTAAGGAILASHDGADRAALAYEARVYGAVAMRRLAGPDEARNELAIYVVATDELAAQLGLPQLA